MTWTPEKIEILRHDWPLGVPAGEIGRKIDKTKSATVAQARRLHLGPHPSGTGCFWSAEEDFILIHGRDGEGMIFPEIAALLPGRSANACKMRYDQLQDGDTAPLLPGVPLAYLDTGGCLFAISPHDVKPHEHRFCNEPAIPGTSWCQAHAIRVGMSKADIDRLETRRKKGKAHRGRIRTAANDQEAISA